MKINALSPWYGAKRKFAPRIVEALGKHSAYWEPFCGSCAVLFSKPPAAMEVINDLHGDLINLARCCSCAAWKVLYDRLERTFVGPDVFADSARVIESQPFEPTLERAYHFMVYSWQGRSGTIGTTGKQSFAVRYTSNGGNPATRFRSAVESMPAWADRLRHCVVLNEDAFHVIRRLEDKVGTAVYVDPPYLTKSTKYVHDFNDQAHADLAAALSRFNRTRVVVSYYDHPRLAELYPGWLITKFEIGKNITQAGKRDEEGADAATEVLITNGGGSPPRPSGPSKTVFPDRPLRETSAGETELVADKRM